MRAAPPEVPSRLRQVRNTRSVQARAMIGGQCALCARCAYGPGVRVLMCGLVCVRACVRVCARVYGCLPVCACVRCARPVVESLCPIGFELRARCRRGQALAIARSAGL